MTRKSVFGPTCCFSFGACPTPAAPARGRACASLGAPAAKMAASGPSSLIALPSLRRGTRRGRALWRTARGGHGRTGACARTLRRSSAARRPPPSRLPRSTCTAASSTRPFRRRRAPPTCCGHSLPCCARTHAPTSCALGGTLLLSTVSACVCSLPARLPVALWTALLRDQPTPQRAFERRARAVRLSNVRRRSVETGGRAATRLVSLVCANVSAALMERLEDCILGDDVIYRAPVSLFWRAAARTVRRARRGRPSPLSLSVPPR